MFLTIRTLDVNPGFFVFGRDGGWRAEDGGRRMERGGWAPDLPFPLLFIRLGVLHILAHAPVAVI